jgi:hypothetical protein
MPRDSRRTERRGQRAPPCAQKGCGVLPCAPSAKGSNMRILIAAAAVLTSTLALADTTTRYSILFYGHPAGAQVTTVHADGQVDVDYGYKENGRGPDIKEHATYSSDGALTSLKDTGKSTFGAPIDESFAVKGGRAQWRSLADHGNVTLSAPAAYVPNDSSFEPVAAFVRQALRQPQGKIAALPGGELTVTKVLDSTVKEGERSEVVSLYAIIGVDTHPDFIWLTADANAKFFAFILPGFVRVIEEGREGQAAELEGLQLEAERARLHELAAKLAHHVAGPVLIRNVRVFDAEHANLLAAQDVYVYRDRIAALYPAGSIPHEAGTVIEAAGACSCRRCLTCMRTRTPGIWCCRSPAG